MNYKFKRLLATFLIMVISGLFFPNKNIIVHSEDDLPPIPPPPKTTAYVRVRAGAGGHITSPQSDEYIAITRASENDPFPSFTISAEPDEGWQFVEWQLEDSSGAGTFADSSGSTTTFTISSDYDCDNPIIIIADFDLLPTVDVNITAETGGHIVSPTGEISVAPWMEASFRIIAEPDEHYSFTQWVLDTAGAGSFANATSNDTTFTTSKQYTNNQPINIRAKFDPLYPLYNINFICDPSLGYFEPSAISPQPEGSRVQFTLKPNHEGQQEKIVGVEVYRDGLDNSPTQMSPSQSQEETGLFGAKVVMNQNDMTIKAVFGLPHSVSTLVVGAGDAIADKESSLQWRPISLTATPAEGYQFIKWTSEDVEILNPTSATDATFEMPDKDVSITAVFEEVVVTEVALNTDDVKKVYNLGDALSLDNLTMTVSKSDDSTETIPVTEDMVSGFDNSKAGKQIINVTYAGHTMTYEIEVNEKENPTPTPTPPKPNSNNDSANVDTAITTDSESTASTRKNEEARPSTGDNRNVLYCIFWISVSTICLISTLLWRRKRKRKR